MRLCFEFDYSQNRPLPKIPNCEVFYKRLFWLYIFNLHLHNSDISFILNNKHRESPQLEFYESSD
jgi:hypothetical protein